MRWRKIGKVFDPSQHTLPNGCVGFAQSPQTLVFDDFVRVYFSTRSVDPTNGKYLSHIAFVDMSRDLRTPIRVNPHTVLPLGKLGCFDEHGIFPMNVLRVGEAVYGYTCGWSRRVSVSVDTAIGLAISTDDGATFQRIGDGPVLAASLKEPCLVGDGFVRFIGGQFHMWYIFGLGWRRYGNDSQPDRIYKIGHATSPDGVNWTKEDGRQIIADSLGEDESQALPTVVEVDGRYLMAFCYRYASDFKNNAARGYRLGFAWSTNLVDWTRDDSYPSFSTTAGEWDSDMQCYPHLFAIGSDICLLYNGNAFGRDGFGLAILDQ